MSVKTRILSFLSCFSFLFLFSLHARYARILYIYNSYLFSVFDLTIVFVRLARFARSPFNAYRKLLIKKSKTGRHIVFLSALGRSDQRGGSHLRSYGPAELAEPS